MYIRLQGKDYGPYAENDLKALIADGKVPFSAWVHWNGQWKLLAEMGDLREGHPEYERMPTDQPSATETELPAKKQKEGPVKVSAESIWFVIREKKKFGPYSSVDLINQLQRKELSSATFVWRPGFDTWQKMSTLAEFSKDTIKKLSTQKAAADILLKRKHSRMPYEIEVIAHDNSRALEGKSMVIGEGGFFLSTAKLSHALGTRLKVHFRDGGGKLPSFNAVAEVVSVVRGDMPGYCLKFVALSDSDRRRISKFVSERRP